MSRKIAVIGAGPAGLTAAYQLARQGCPVDVYEADDAVGGMAKTIDLWGQRVDLGPHRFFSSDPRVNGLWLEVLGSDYEMVRRLTRIYYRDTFFRYPLAPRDVLRGLGVLEAGMCVASYARALLWPPRDTSNFQNWVISRFGSRLYGLFFKSYSEKLWGIPCTELDADFAAQRIRKFSLAEAIRSAVRPAGASRHKTLVDEFAYPRGGAGMLYERMAEKTRALGGTIRLGTRIRLVKPAAGDDQPIRVELADGTSRSYDHVISTMPITLLVEQLGAPEDVLAHARALRFRNTILVYLRITAQDVFPDQWIYVHSQHLRTGRVTNFRNWSGDITGGKADTILCLEYWCYDSDELWRESSAALVELAASEIALTGLVKPEQIREGSVVRVPKCYPVYAKGYRQHLKPVEAYLSGVSRITAIGRYGAFKYNNQDHSILMGLLAAENVAGTGKHDLWSLNTDYEYQESSRITATGLAENA